MNNDKIKKILSSVKNGSISVEGAVKKLKHFPYEDISFAKVDHHRHLRQGVPEVIFASGKTKEQVMSIAKAMYKKAKDSSLRKLLKIFIMPLRSKALFFILHQELFQ